MPAAKLQTSPGLLMSRRGRAEAGEGGEQRGGKKERGTGERGRGGARVRDVVAWALRRPAAAATLRRRHAAAQRPASLVHQRAECEGRGRQTAGERAERR